jgi:hypothetical protein
MIVKAMITATTTLTCGSCWPSLIFPKIQSGRVF